MVGEYNPKEIEAKWQKRWLEEKVFAARDESPKQKYYQLETFPYPSGAGLHVGHPKGYIAEDIHARYMRMNGKEVLYTMGWDAFGLPTENYALKVGKTPQEVTRENTDNFRRQVRMFGLSYDWSREINTSNPDYYKWTQWLFIQLFKNGLAYRKASKVNWCPKDQTVLANEQVIGGKCERCGSEIEERDMEQWFVKITQYADRLLAGLKDLDWPAATIKRQEDWIGRSDGALIKFPLKDSASAIEIFTTRPDTLFGATYLVLAPEHPWVTLAINDQRSTLLNKSEVKSYVESASHKTERMRQEEAKEKTGVELKGMRAINPVTREEIPIWVADYVLGSYGTGAIMAVPAHDERDFEFAKKFGLPVRKVIAPPVLENGLPEVSAAIGGGSPDIRVKSDCWIGSGILINSGKFSGMDSEAAKSEITKDVGGEKKTQYKLRDWSVSRQRYWGVPIPMIHCEACRASGAALGGIVPVPEGDLPVILPELKDFQPQGMPPLAASPEFMNVTCPQCGGAAKRDPETLDTFVDSSWYYLRYLDPHNADAIFDKEKVAHWMPVDLYVIGAEHTVLHLLYSRFIANFLHDGGLLNFDEPFATLRHQGLILAADGQKMSKSKGNVVNPDEIVDEFGADTARLFWMFMGPFEDANVWNPKGILGVERFLKRAWKYASDLIAIQQKPEYRDAATNPLKKSILHKTIKKVGEDIEAFKFNTAISALMILLNQLSEIEEGSGEVLSMLDTSDFGAFVKILHPFAPHMAQDLWSRMNGAGGGKGNGADNDIYLDFASWPHYDPALIKDEKIMIVLQVNSRVRASVEVDATLTEAVVKELALANAKVKQAMDAVALGAAPKKIIYVDKKLVNIVI